MKYLLLLLLSSTAYAGQAVLTWTAPTLNVDGSAITGPVSYNVYSGTQGQANKPLLAGGISALTYTATISGKVCFNVTAVAGGIESAPSNEGCKTITPNPPVLTVAKNAYQKQGAKIVLVGSIPLDVHCGLDANCKAPWGAELFNVPRARVKFAPHKDNGSQPMGICA